MAKKQAKKLDLILSELAKLRSEVKALGKVQAALSAQLANEPAPRKPARPARARKPAAAAKTKAPAAPKRPVLVAGSEAPEAQGRSASRAAGGAAT